MTEEQRAELRRLAESVTPMESGDTAPSRGGFGSLRVPARMVVLGLLDALDKAERRADGIKAAQEARWSEPCETCGFDGDCWSLAHEECVREWLEVLTRGAERGTPCTIPVDAVRLLLHGRDAMDRGWQQAARDRIKALEVRAEKAEARLAEAQRDGLAALQRLTESVGAWAFPREKQAVADLRRALGDTT